MSQAVTVPPPASAAQALGMLQSAMGYLAAADATAMAAETQAQCLRVLEQVSSVGTAARTSILAAFTSGQGYSADADYSPRAWLIHKTHITKGAAVGYTAWVRAPPRTRRSPRRWRRGRSRSRSPGPSAGGPTSCPRTARRTRTRSCSARRPAARMWRTWPGWPGRSTPAPCPGPRQGPGPGPGQGPGPGRGRGVRGPVGAGGDHVRGCRGADRGPVPGVRVDRGHGAGCAVRPGRGGGCPEPAAALP